MIDLLLRNGDLVLDGYGDISLCGGESDDIIQTANNNIMLRFANNMYHRELGNKIFTSRVKLNSSGMETVAHESSVAILDGDSRVSDIKSITATVSGKNECTIDYVLTLTNGNMVDGRASINISNMDGEENGI